MNQKGEATLTLILLMVVINSVLLLYGLRLHHNWQKIEARSKIFLCTKEIKEETVLFVENIEKLNWLIRNTDKAEKVAYFIPFVWAYIGKAKKIKLVAKSLQLKSLTQYLITLKNIKKKNCPIPLKDFISPYKLGMNLGFQRDQFEQTLLRKNKWTSNLKLSDYQILLQYEINRQALWPKLQVLSLEKKGKLPFTSF